MRNAQAGRHGFTLLEITVALIIVLVLAAVTVPTLISSLEFQKISDTRDQLVELSDAVSNPGGTGFFNRVTRYPGRVSELSQPITTVVANHPNSCGLAFSNAQVGNWTSFGPFLNTFIPTTGLPVPMGRIEEILVRTPAGGGAGTLAFRMLDVRTSEAIELDYLMDASDGLLAGTVRWVTPSVTGGAGYADISYLISIGAAC